MAISSPLSAASAAALARASSVIAESVSASGWRRSSEKNTDPGMTFREFGETAIVPTVARASGAASVAMPWSVSTSRAAPTSASLRRSIGVVPACDSIPVTVTSNQRMPWTPRTTPMVLPSASRIGPCSIWASKKAPTSRPPQGMSPA